MKKPQLPILTLFLILCVNLQPYGHRPMEGVPFDVQTLAPTRAVFFYPRNPLATRLARRIRIPEDFKYEDNEIDRQRRGALQEGLLKVFPSNKESIQTLLIGLKVFRGGVTQRPAKEGLSLRAGALLTCSCVAHRLRAF